MATTCPTKYYFDNTSGQCLQCKPQCAVCAELNACITCMTGLILDNTLNECVCSDQTKVLNTVTGTCSSSACATGYYKDAYDICQSCDANMPGCLACTTATSCTTCNTPTYTLSGDSCICSGG